MQCQETGYAHTHAHIETHTLRAGDKAYVFVKCKYIDMCMYVMHIEQRRLAL